MAPSPTRLSEPTGTVRVLRVRAFLVLWANAAVVFLGVMAQNVARTWLAFDLEPETSQTTVGSQPS